MRPDGKRVKSDDAEYAVVPHIMVNRNDSLNFIEITVPLAPMQKYLNEKRKEGVVLSHLALVLAAYTRIVGEFPLLNRFIVNKKMAKNKLVKIKLVKSLIGSSEAQRKVAAALGLKKLNQVVEHYNSDTIMGMANKISHLVEVSE